MPTKEDILDSIANMTVLELSELLSAFEERFGVTAAAPVAVAGAAPAAAAPAVSGGPAQDVVRLLDADGLVALAEPRGDGTLKPVVGFRG